MRLLLLLAVLWACVVPAHALDGTTTGIDVEDGAVKLITTEVNGTTWGNSSATSINWVFNLSAGTDPQITARDNTWRFTVNEMEQRFTSPRYVFIDTDTIDDNEGFTIDVNAVELAAGDDNYDTIFQQRIAGALTTLLFFDGTVATDALDIILGATTVTSVTLDGGTGNVIVDSAAGIPMTTVAQECITLEAGSIVPNDTNGCQFVTNNGTNFSYRACNFDATTDEDGTFSFTLPEHVTGSTATVQLDWISNNASCAGAGTDDVCWAVRSLGLASDAPWHTASFGTILIEDDNCIANGDLIQHTFVGTLGHGWAANERAAVQVFRDANESDAGCAAGEDDYDADAQLLSLRLCFDVDNINSGE